MCDHSFSKPITKRLALGDAFGRQIITSQNSGLRFPHRIKLYMILGPNFGGEIEALYFYCDAHARFILEGHKSPRWNVWDLAKHLTILDSPLN